MTNVELRNALEAAKALDTEDDKHAAYYAALDRVGRQIGGQPRLLMLHAAERLPKIPAATIEKHPALHVAHWLVLAEHEEPDMWEMWANRIVYMNFTAKVLLSEVKMALASRAFKAAKAAKNAK